MKDSDIKKLQSNPNNIKNYFMIEDEDIWRLRADNLEQLLMEYNLTSKDLIKGKSDSSDSDKYDKSIVSGWFNATQKGHLTIGRCEELINRFFPGADLAWFIGVEMFPESTREKEMEKIRESVVNSALKLLDKTEIYLLSCNRPYNPVDLLSEEQKKFIINDLCKRAIYLLECPTDFM